MCARRAQAYVGAFLRRANGGREAANAAALEGDLHLDENGQIIRPAARTEDGAADPADAMHDVGTFAQVCTTHTCLLWWSAGNCPPMLPLPSSQSESTVTMTGTHDCSHGGRRPAAAAGPPATEEDGHGTPHVPCRPSPVSFEARRGTC